MGFSYSAVQVFTFLVLLLGTAAIIVSLATSYWTVREASLSAVGTAFHQGLWERCLEAKIASFDTGTCKNRYQALWEDVSDSMQNMDVDRAGQTFKNSDLHIYEFTTGICLTVSALIGIFALLTAPCCCHKCGGCQSFITLFAFLASCAGIVTFVVGRQKGWSVQIGNEDWTVETSHPFDGTYGWSFWVGCAGSFLQLIASLMFCIGRGRAHGYEEHL